MISALLIYFTSANALKRQREAEIKRQESQERFQKLFETNLDAILKRMSKMTNQEESRVP